MQDPKMTPKQFRAALAKADLSQRRFALWAGFDVVTVNRWARGTRKVPQYAAILVALVAKHAKLADLVHDQRMP